MASVIDSDTFLQTPETIPLVPPPTFGSGLALTPQIANLSASFPGGGAFFAWTGKQQLMLPQPFSLPRPFVVNTVNFLVSVVLPSSTDATGAPAPSAVVCAASLSTVQNGVVVAVSSMDISRYVFVTPLTVRSNSFWTFEASAQPPQPLPVDLGSDNPILNVVVGVQLPVPMVIGSGTPAPGSSVVAPQLVFGNSGVSPDFITQLQVIGQRQVGYAP